MTEFEVRAALRTVIDPELGVNIVDLGLVYGIEIDGTTVHITMTMTTPACPLRDYLQGLVESELLLHLPELKRVVVDVVDDPPWNSSRMSEAARAQLG